MHFDNHACSKPCAPHLSMKGRTWFKVMIENYDEMHRPESQGGLWFIARRMKVVCPVCPCTIDGGWIVDHGTNYFGIDALELLKSANEEK